MTAVSSVYAQRLLVTFFVVSFGIYLFLATVTYTPFDPGWMHISSDTQQVSNASGVAGAWIADLLFGFLGWGSVLIPLFLFIEAIQVWWPRSFLNRPFRYAAQFFIILSTSTLLYLHWNLPADTLENASGGIIGYELGESLKSLLTIYGATAFLVFVWGILVTLAFGIQWHKTWATLKATPKYLQDLFYRNVPESESAFDLTEQTVTTANKVTKKKAEKKTTAEINDEKTVVVEKPVQSPQNSPIDAAAQRLFADVVAKEEKHEANQRALAVQAEVDAEAEDRELEQTLAKAHALEEEQRAIASGEVWKALQHDQEQHHNRDIDALLKAADDDQLSVQPHSRLQQITDQQGVKNQTHSALDWDDEQVFDELLHAVPEGKQATDIHHPFTHQAKDFANDELANELDSLVDALDQDEPSVVKTTSSYAQSSPLVKATIQTNLTASHVSDEEKQRVASNKDAFREAWQETTGKPVDEQDAFDFDAPLTDVTGRPLSRAMQVAERRKDLSILPSLDVLDKVDPNKKVNFTDEQLARLSELLEIKLQEFNVKAKVIEAQPGPVVTRFELDLAPGVKASKVTNISRDLARSMSMASVRVVEVIPGKPYIGIEVPNSAREMVRLIELLETPAYRDPNGLISMAMGKDISGHPVLTDLAKAPHMLVAGTTGSGKSVAVNAMILSMLLKYTPDQLRLILIDPKQLELANYNDIPHLLTPVVTDMKDAVNALNWCVNEMERRYKLMSFLKIRKLADYNRKVEEAIANSEDLIDPTWKPSDSATQERAPRLQPLPSIVIVADEFADMIMQVGKKAEEMITRLAQKSRAAGIHLLLATQRPSVDVITGLIKANIPTRVALRVNSKIDSRTILDAGGAEDLLGHGDMLFLGPGKIEPERVHGAFISDDEVNRICDAWRERGSPNYVDEILTPYDEEPSSRGFEDNSPDGSGPDRDVIYDQAVAFVLESRKTSASSLQRKFSLGYNRAARIVEQMEEDGILSAPVGSNGKRDILV